MEEKHKTIDMKKKLGKLFGRASFVSEKRLIIGTALLVLLTLIVITLSVRATVRRISDDERSGQQQESGETFVIRHPFTGETLDQELSEVPQLFAVMVENAADAWPLSGVDEALLVIEAPVEGNIPRFITYFSNEINVEKIGPVRSARPYYVEWNTAMNAPYAHVGGSPEALELIHQTDGYIDLNQFYQSEYFWRQTTGGRYAPHNVYTSTELLVSTLEELVFEPKEVTLFTYKEDRPVSEDEAKSIHIDWTSGSLYDVDWIYQAENNTYEREQGGVVYSAKNIIVMETDVTVVDDVGRKDLRTIGEGDAMFIQDGEVFFGTWKKDSQESQLVFLTQSGDEISMNAGKTWIEVVPSLTKVSILEN